MIDNAITELAEVVGVSQPALWSAGHPLRVAPPAPDTDQAGTGTTSSTTGLNSSERTEVLEVLHPERFVDLSPGEVYAILLDEGRYLCSGSTMHGILRDQHGQMRERRRHAVHPPRVKPQMVAERADQCWSWDITKLHGPAKWTYYYLYSIIDIYSRYTVGWMVATTESKELAERLLADTISKQNIDRGS